MKAKILALLIAKFSGVRKDGLAQLAGSLSLQATTDAEAQALVDKVNEQQVTDFVKDWRAEVDKEINTATSTHETNLKKKFDFVEKKTGDPNPNPEPKPGNGDPKEVAKMITDAVTAAVKPIQEKLTSLEAGKVNETRKQSLEALIKGDKYKDVPEQTKNRILKDFGRMSFEKDEDFDTYLTETGTDLDALNQEIADSGLSQHSRPAFGQKVNKEGVSTATQSYIESSKTEGSQFEGKKIG